MLVLTLPCGSKMATVDGVMYISGSILFAKHKNTMSAWKLISSVFFIPRWCLSMSTENHTPIHRHICHAFNSGFRLNSFCNKPNTGLIYSGFLDENCDQSLEKLEWFLCVMSQKWKLLGTHNFCKHLLRFYVTNITFESSFHSAFSLSDVKIPSIKAEWVNESSSFRTCVSTQFVLLCILLLLRTRNLLAKLLVRYRLNASQLF